MMKLIMEKQTTETIKNNDLIISEIDSTTIYKFNSKNETRNG
jgi:hypothetical protein